MVYILNIMAILLNEYLSYHIVIRNSPERAGSQFWRKTLQLLGRQNCPRDVKREFLLPTKASSMVASESKIGLPSPSKLILTLGFTPSIRSLKVI